MIPLPPYLPQSRSARVLRPQTGLILWLLLLSWSCGKNCTEARLAATAVATVASTSRQLPAAGLAEVVVHVDVSSSMSGYVRSGFEFSRVLAGLDQVAGQLSPPHTIAVRTVGKTTKHLGGIDELRRLADDRDSFVENESHLVSVLQSIYRRRTSEASGEDAGTQTVLPSARCHIIVTDGLQYTSGRGLCDPGHDAECLGERFRDLVAQGWSMHVFAVRSQFDGVVDVPGRKKGVRLKSVPSDPTTFRPFLLFVLVDGQHRGNTGPLTEVVSKIRAFLASTLPPVANESLFHELSLSAPLVLMRDFQIITDTWIPERSAHNPAHHVAGEWEAPDGSLVPDSFHRVQVAYRRAMLAHATPFLLQIGMTLGLSEEGRLTFDEAELSRITEGLRLVEVSVNEALPEVATDDKEPDGGAPSAGKPEPAAVQSSRIAKILQIRPLTRQPPNEFNSEKPIPDATGEDLERGEHGPDGISEGTGSLTVYAKLSWSKLGDYPPVTVLTLESDRTLLSASMPDWIGEWSVDRTTLVAARSSPTQDRRDKARLLDLDDVLGSLASKELVGTVVVEPHFIVLEPCAAKCCVER